jgi:hypothetical protein
MSLKHCLRQTGWTFDRQKGSPKKEAIVSGSHLVVRFYQLIPRKDGEAKSYQV